MTSWIVIERVSYVLFSYATLLKKPPRVARIITLSTLLIVAGMHLHKLLFCRKTIDLDGQSAYAVDSHSELSVYDHVTVLTHYLIPFCIQILSITILILLAVRSRSRTGKKRDPLIE